MIYNTELYPHKLIELFPQKYIEEWTNNEEIITFKKGDDITNFRQHKNCIYLVKKGSVSVFHLHVDGKECIIGLFSPGEFINLFDVFTEKESSMLFKALTEVTVVAIQKEKMKKIVEQNPPIAMALLNHFSNRMQEMAEVLGQIAYGKVEERLIFIFKKISDPSKNKNGWQPLSCSITHQDLAGMVGSTRETVTLLINKLIQLGIILQKEDRIWIKIKKLDNK